ncbi:Zinc finger RING-type [Penicillium viridicatum]|nr:Zinc finger RING-type [Penicillium viridicatum]
MFDSGMLDGCYVAKTERIDDISLAEEERLESMKTSTDSVNAVPEVEDSIDAIDDIIFGFTNP